MADTSCEIRVLSYCRPKWLRESLRSLIEQDHPNWKAIVFDDTPDDSCREVVNDIAESRILYRKNEPRAGCSGNINNAFRTTSYLGCTYACVLEDDSWFYPNYLSENIRAMARTGVSVMLRNAAIWDRHTDPPRMLNETTLGSMSPGVLRPPQLHAHLFFAGCFNPSWFWMTDCGVEFTVAEARSGPCEQEFLRVANVRVPVLFSPEPMVAWGYAPSRQMSEVPRNDRSTRLAHLRRQSKMRELSREEGPELLEYSAQIAHRLKCKDRHARECADCFIFNNYVVSNNNIFNVYLQFVKAITKRILYLDYLFRRT